ncbi:Hydroxymethylpyrimidine/phosphomethylpyrimidine kinase [bioreactor metagenome]|uniref:Hydroxymethylpyrimidine/phosphomethylpyrimidine kinase n=2 Tax=root TaxID=1 RepID=A0A323USI7_9RHOO|nr:PfkB family carbohydrate kinase [Parazoarcus communis]NMG50191.1 hydroxymethylpyrimidine/phosphomethylpyrimidine kinase [Parazoarcus communis]NMG70732.1 hydroxymethylpyrimidine/phosphomethylpyrimidine kinase [Parazoarcus communis SWub3 = DSM 12120]PZA15484.1 hydroxymethylpyrimidine/phosphomethylpyrimidine kinase [Azoarcus communis] [Parazoarcus communis SWub3 = DSM 12120]
MPVDIPDLPPAVLCLSASDATAGGGLPSDILTLASMGCHPLPVQTASVVRDTRGIEECEPLDTDILVAQLRTVLEDIPVHAFKLGYGGSVDNLVAIAEVLSDYPGVPLVVEPALYTGVGVDEDMAAVLTELILSQTTLLVASRHEVLRLAGLDDDEAPALSAEEAVARLLEIGVEYVLLTGGGDHGPQVINVLVDASGVVRTDAWERLPGRFVGAGATIAAAAAAALAHGMALPEAVREAQEFAQQALRHAYLPGMGRAVPDRFFWARGKGAVDD